MTSRSIFRYEPGTFGQDLMTSYEKLINMRMFKSVRKKSVRNQNAPEPPFLHYYQRPCHSETMCHPRTMIQYIIFSHEHSFNSRILLRLADFVESRLFQRALKGDRSYSHFPAQILTKSHRPTAQIPSSLYACLAQILIPFHCFLLMNPSPSA